MNVVASAHLFEAFVSWSYALAARHGQPCIAERAPVQAQSTEVWLVQGSQRTTAPKPQQKAFFCRLCGHSLELRIPAREIEWREVCKSCGYIDYVNPKMASPSLFWYGVPLL